MRVGFPPGLTCIGHSRKLILFWGELCVLNVGENRFRKTLFDLLKCSFGFIFCKFNTSNSNYNNCFSTKISWYCMLMCCVCAFLLRREYQI
jgi:hypothetical protein